jgi:hypothetical protein
MPYACRTGYQTQVLCISKLTAKAQAEPDTINHCIINKVHDMASRRIVSLVWYKNHNNTHCADNHIDYKVKNLILSFLAILPKTLLDKVFVFFHEAHLIDTHTDF